jgi:hypothetical protein
LSRSIAGVFAISRLALSQFQKAGFPASKLFPFGYFVPSQLRLESVEIIRLNRQSHSNIKAIFIGSLIKRKGIDLLIELSGSAEQAGFDQKQFMKNLPQFMEMISMMYYSVKGSKLPYNKEAVLQKCKKYGCKTGVSTKYKKTKHTDYKFMESNQTLKEEINRIKLLMK